SGQHGECAKRQAAAEQAPTLHGSDQGAMVVQDRGIRDFIRAEWRLHDRDALSPWPDGPTLGPPANIAQSVRGTSNARTTWTTRKPKITAMPRKWRMRADWKPPSSDTKPENCTGFQIASPVTTCAIPARITMI